MCVGAFEQNFDFSPSVRRPEKKTFLLDFEGLSFHTLDSREEPVLFDLITSESLKSEKR